MDAKLVDDFCNPDKTEADKEKLLETIKKSMKHTILSLHALCRNSK